jgi:hypothetical protein
VSKQPPADVIRAASELESSLGVKLFIIRGRRNTFGWFFSPLPEDEIGLRRYRWLLSQQEVKVTRAFRMVNGDDCRYLLFDGSSTLKEDIIELDGRKIVATNIKKLEENIELAKINAHLFHIKNRNVNVKFDSEYVRRAEEMLRSLPTDRSSSNEPESSSIVEESQPIPSSAPKEIKPVLLIPAERENVIQTKEKGIFIKKNELAEVFKNADVMMKLDILNTIFGEFVSSPDTSYKDIQKFQEELPKLVHQRKRLLEHLEELNHFETLIKDAQTTEEDLQKFLENSTWIFGEEYAGVLNPKENIGSKTDAHRPDFVLNDIARKGDAIIFSPDMFELKKASEEFTKQDPRKKDELAPRASVLNAIWQGFRYVDARMRKGIFSKAFIVIGRHGGEKEKQDILRRLNFHLPNIQLVTYDELLNRARKRIKHYLAEDK